MIPEKEIPKQTKKINLKTIVPKTINQSSIFKEFKKEKHLFIHGIAGSGKTFVAIYLALNSIINENKYKKLIIIRSAVPSRRQGFLPGNEEEKSEIYEIPYEDIVNELFNANQNVYKLMKHEKKIKFLTTSYLRGITIDNAIILVDEIQNFGPGEIDTVMTRIGKNCQVIICGDSKQNDLIYLREDSCIEDIHTIIKQMSSFSSIEMMIEDIQRNDVVKEWILTRDGYSNTLPKFFTRQKRYEII